MDKKTTNIITVIAVVAVIAVAAIAVFGVLQNNDVTKVSSKYALQVMGNADEDMTMSDKDVRIIQQIVDGKLDFADYPYADANNDGVVDAKDVALAKDLVNRKAGTTAYVVNIDFKGKTVVTEVEYPLSKIVPYGINVLAPIISIDGGRCIAAYFASGYPVNEASMKGAVDLKGGSRSIGDAAWQKFLTTDAEVHFDAFVVTYDARAQVIDSYVQDLDDAGIPLICYPCADADGELSAVVTLGFLFGGNSEKLGSKYADIYLDVVGQIDKKLGNLADAGKTVYLAMTMGTSVCQNDSTYNAIGKIAAGVPYYTTDSEFAKKYKGTSSTASKTVEALANINMDKIVSYRSVDHPAEGETLDDLCIEFWEYTNSSGVKVYDLFDYADVKEKALMINNIIPAPARVAYTVYWLYPDQFSESWANSIMQKFIDEKFTPYIGKTIGETLVTIFDYEDYQEAKS